MSDAADKPAVPRNLEQATALLQRYSLVDQQIAAIEADRNARIATANTICDEALEPLITLRADIAAKVEPWFGRAAPTLLKGKRKSIEIAGVKIGYRATRETLVHRLASDDEAVAALQASPYKRVSLKVRYTIDRPALLKLLQLGGKRAEELVSIGFGKEPSVEQFFIQRAEQSGTIAD